MLLFRKNLSNKFRLLRFLPNTLLIFIIYRILILTKKRQEINLVFSILHVVNLKNTQIFSRLPVSYQSLYL